MNDDLADILDEFELTTFHKIVSGSPGGYDPSTGLYIPGSPPLEVQTEGLMLPLSSSDLRFDEAGTYTTHDRKVYTRETLTEGQEIKCKGKTYKVHGEKDYNDQTGLYVYYVKRVGGAA